MKSRSGVPSDRSTGRCPPMIARIVSGTMREKFTSPPPYTFASRVTATGMSKVAAYERAITSAHAFDTSYGYDGSSGWSSRYGRVSTSPYALSEEATTTDSTRSPTTPAARTASSSVYVPRTFDSKVASGERLATPTRAWAARWKIALNWYWWMIRR